MPVSERKSTFRELRTAAGRPGKLVSRPVNRDEMGCRDLTFNQERPKVEEPRRLRGRVSLQQRPVGKAAAPGRSGQRGKSREHGPGLRA